MDGRWMEDGRWMKDEGEKKKKKKKEGGGERKMEEDMWRSHWSESLGVAGGERSEREGKRQGSRPFFYDYSGLSGFAT